MAQSFKKGDHVSWHTPQGTTRGEVVRVIRERTTIDGHTVAASADAPQYEVKSERTGKHAVHRPESLSATRPK